MPVRGTRTGTPNIARRRVLGAPDRRVLSPLVQGQFSLHQNGTQVHIVQTKVDVLSPSHARVPILLRFPVTPIIFSPQYNTENGEPARDIQIWCQVSQARLGLALVIRARAETGRRPRRCPGSRAVRTERSLGRRGIFRLGAAPSGKPRTSLSGRPSGPGPGPLCWLWPVRPGARHRSMGDLRRPGPRLRRGGRRPDERLRRPGPTSPCGPGVPALLRRPERSRPRAVGGPGEGFPKDEPKCAPGDDAPLEGGRRAGGQPPGLAQHLCRSGR